MKSLPAIMATLLIASCATYSGSGLEPGVARLEDVTRVMGQPAMRWQNPDNSMQLAFPHGPFGLHTYMAYLAPDGRLQRIENVMEPKAFALIRPGMTEAEVLRTLGPSYPGWTSYYKARDELVWEWRYCDDWNKVERFHVLFDRTEGTVRSTMSLLEKCGGIEDCLCAR
ncbi:MAG: hypothetical protein A3F73_03440 [Gallionellales bacterium RIFCSPLOWO2_12_FULL_59_22]|nr:MAG: hypothetical protein A3H99_09105 [Gallionellales bacterium RIFCSPLOWO2_02_FULL_59_110]OGT02238.1 MAG: hypothetical protein A2Z65_04455 [Gallionellales bacterium RIFCSPLOWO2_02_58_13]OGT14373.1 MAG: hypothetical protein A3F73_03440 [Gallionellales bacterium RIFCSPLOWO2_12_FULL_59_22]